MGTRQTGEWIDDYVGDRGKRLMCLEPGDADDRRECFEVNETTFGVDGRKQPTFVPMPQKAFGRRSDIIVLEPPENV